MTRVYCDICGKEVVRKKEIWKHTLAAREGNKRVSYDEHMEEICEMNMIHEEAVNSVKSIMRHDNPLLHFHDEAGMEAGLSRNERSGSSRSGWSGPADIAAGGVTDEADNQCHLL